MRIAIDSRMIRPTMHGISRYTFNLLKEISKIDKTNDYFLIVNDLYLKNFIADKKRFSLLPTSVPLYGVKEQAIIPKILYKNKIDIFHSPTYSAPIIQPCRVVMTIHDLIHIIFPEQNARIHQFYYKHIVKKAAHKAQKVLTVSECSQNDIANLLDIDKEKIIITYNAVEDNYKEITDQEVIDSVCRKYLLSKKFILYIGNHRFHKNLNLLMDAFVQLKNKGYEHFLALSGKKNFTLLNRVKQYHDQVIFLGDLSNEELPLLYNAADLFVMPSLYEGFGLPALEAMACNTPVIVSNKASLPEVVGEAGIFVDPYNPDELFLAIEKVITNDRLKEDLKEKGKKQAARFSWAYVAKRTLQVYEEIYSEPRIGFNAQKYSSMNTGVGVYTNQLSKTFHKTSSSNHYYIYTSKRFSNDPCFISDHINLSCSSLTDYNFIRILWEHLLLPAYQFRDRVDIFHYPDHTLSLLAKVCPVIITVHDLAFIKFPELFTYSRRFYKNFAIARSLKMADFIIAVSHSTKQDIMNTFPVLEKNIEVIYLGADKCYRPIENCAEFRKRALLPERFILFVGTLEPRKNLVRLIQAFAILKKKMNVKHKLLIGGTKGWLFKDIFKEVERLNLKEEVCFTGLIKSDELPLLYNCAELFVYPSLYEGFGLPPLEAMACGTPVITSNSSSLPEVVGDAGLMVDPLNVEQLAQTMYRVISNKELHTELRKKGLERAKFFTWEKTVEKTVMIYKKALQEIRARSH